MLPTNFLSGGGAPPRPVVPAVARSACSAPPPFRPRRPGPPRLLAPPRPPRLSYRPSWCRCLAPRARRAAPPRRTALSRHADRARGSGCAGGPSVAAFAGGAHGHAAATAGAGRAARTCVPGSCRAARGSPRPRRSASRPTATSGAARGEMLRWARRQRGAPPRTRARRHDAELPRTTEASASPLVKVVDPALHTSTLSDPRRSGPGSACFRTNRQELRGRQKREPEDRYPISLTRSATARQTPSLAFTDAYHQDAYHQVSACTPKVGGAQIDAVRVDHRRIDGGDPGGLVPHRPGVEAGAAPGASAIPCPTEIVGATVNLPRYCWGAPLLFVTRSKPASPSTLKCLGEREAHARAARSTNR